jgi:hypothetical protein
MLSCCERRRFALQSKEGHKWWAGCTLCGALGSQFLHAPESAAKAVKPDFVDIVSSIVESHVEKAKRLANPPDKALQISAPEECLGWV